MRNLALLAHHEASSELRPPTTAATLAITTCPDTNATYTLSNEGILCGFNDSLDELICEQPLDVEGSPVCVQHVSAMDSVVVLTTSGQFIVYNTVSEEAEIVGEVDSGIIAAAWSPDQELLVLINGVGDLLCMTKNFDVLNELPLATDEFGAAAPITVGWGKAETQFQGKRGKLSEQPKVPDAQVPFDDGKPRVSWRGDGQYFVTSTVEAINDEQSSRRILRVWSRDCVLQSTSEKVGGLESALTWRPSGNLIASTQRLPHRHDVVFFERNGLRHGEFTLPMAKLQSNVRQLEWNADSSILAVWSEDFGDDISNYSQGSSSCSRVQLWTMGNYHWYLKQEFVYQAASPNGVVSAVAWHPEDAHRLFVATATGGLDAFDFASVTSTSIGGGATVAVIDGSNVLMTPLHRCVVPPPMSDSQLKLDNAVQAVSFLPQLYGLADPASSTAAAADAASDTLASASVGGTARDGNDLAVLDSSYRVHLYTDADEPEERKVHSIVQLDQLSFEGNDLNWSHPRHLAWVGRDLFVFVASVRDQNRDVIVDVHISSTAQDASSAAPHVARVVDVPARVQRMIVLPDSSELLVHLADGGLWVGKLDSDSNGQLELSAIGALPEACVDIASLSLGVATEQASRHIIGLTQRNHLYVDEMVLTSTCNSFAVHDAFLIYTTTSHKCHFVSRSLPLAALRHKEQKAHRLDHSVREVERGARIVAVVPDDVALILQMPRGNLECIYPRPLVLFKARGLLARSKYRKAFLILRKHRISLNLLYDDDPDTFATQTERFLRALGKVDYINLFVSELRDEDVNISMYPDPDAPLPATDAALNEKAARPGKVNNVCQMMINAADAVDRDKYLKCSLTAFLKSKPPRIGDALGRVLALHNSAADGNSGADRARAALKYMLVLIDEQTLYNAALALYNLEFALLVAQVAQFDPQEFVPFLQRLRSMSEPLKRHAIDMHLKNYRLALKHLAEAGDEHFQACIDLVKEHSLYREALRIFSGGEKHRLMLSLTGDHLMEKAQYRDAGMMYAQCLRVKDAIKAFTQAHEWKVAMALAPGAMPESEVRNVAVSLVESLKATQRYGDAAVLVLEYLKDVDRAVHLLAEAEQWMEAYRQCHSKGRVDLINKSLKPAVVGFCERQTQSMADVGQHFQKHVMRLQVVREEKAKRAALIEQGLFDELDDHRDSDLYSDTSSVTSLRSRSSKGSRSSKASRRTAKSAKGRRKHAAKRFSLKEGGVFEEEALTHELGRLARLVDDARTRVANAISFATLVGEFDVAQALQEAYAQCRHIVVTGIPRAWPTPVKPEQDANSAAAAEEEQELEPKPKLSGDDRSWRIGLLNN